MDTSHKRQKVLESESSMACESSNQLQLDDIVSDPALRKPISEFNVRVRDRIRREYVSKGPCQPFGHDFPKRQFGKSSRCFRDVWFSKYDWLEYSVSQDAAFCFVCYLFKATAARSDDVFIKSGFTNWKKAIEKFKEHIGGVGSVHNSARILLDGFKNQRKRVSHMIVGQTDRQQVDYHACLTATLDATRLLLRQGLSFCGHDESLTSLDKGNFLQILQWSGERCSDAEKVIMSNASTNIKMTSPDIQKRMVKSCAIETTRAILNELGDRSFTLLVDESRDVSVKERVTVVLRFVNSSGAVIERLLAVVHVPLTTPKCLKDTIDRLFATHGLSLSRLRGQGYDGASNMRREFHGLKSLILQENSCAMYIHCFAHQLQLVVVSTAKTNSHVSDFFSVVGMIVTAVSSSCKIADQLRQIEHDRLVEQLESRDVSSGPRQNQETDLTRPGDTRWGSYHVTLIFLLLKWPSIIEVLHNVFHDGSNQETKGLSGTLVMRMNTYGFVFVLHLMKHILGITRNLSIVLQQRDQNIVQVISLIQTVKDLVQDMRETRWESFLTEVETFCLTHSIDIVDMDDTINSRIRMKLDEEKVKYYQLYRVEIYCAVLDLLAEEMNNRFSEISTELLCCVSCLDPSDSFSKFDVQKLIRLAELYPEDFSLTDRAMLSSELENFIDNVTRDDQFKMLRDLESLSKRMVETGRDIIFSLVYRLIELALLLPIATASVERVFSAMNTVKSDLRNKMGDEWLNDSLVVYIEKEVFLNIDNESILSTFRNLETRKYQLPSRSISSSRASGLVSSNHLPSSR